MPRVFLNYRRQDSAGHAGRLYDRLAAEFGEKNVFIDVDAIEVGSDFVERINQSVDQCDAVLAVIGDSWLKEEAGRRRLDESDDFVRVEIRAALEAGVTVVPVLVQGAEMPPSEALPVDLRPLARRHAIELSDARWNHDVGKLIGAIKRIEAEHKRLQPSRLQRLREKREAARPVEQEAAATAPTKARPAPRALTKAHLALLAGTATAAAIVGVLVGGGSEDVADASEVRGGNLRLAVDDSWRDAPPGVQLPGLDPENSIALGHADIAGAVLAAGTLSAPEPGRDPLPSALRARGDAPNAKPVSLGDVQALSYDGRLRTGGENFRLRVLIVPTASGYEGVYCAADPGAFASFVRACERVAATAELDGVDGAPVGPSHDYATELAAILGDLGDARTSGFAALDTKRDPDVQADAARGLAAAHTEASDALGELMPPPQDAAATARVKQAAREVAAGFTAMASAVAHGNASAYAAARRRVDAADTKLFAAIDDLGGGRYVVR